MKTKDKESRKIVRSANKENRKFSLFHYFLIALGTLIAIGSFYVGYFLFAMIGFIVVLIAAVSIFFLTFILAIVENAIEKRSNQVQEHPNYGGYLLAVFSISIFAGILIAFFGI